MSRHHYHHRNGFHHHHHHHNPRDKSIFGIGLALVGVVLLCKTFGLFYFSYIVTWPFILIIIGLLIGFKSSFRSPASWILLIIGAANLTPQFYILGHPSSTLIWPLILIGSGIFIALRSRRKLPYAREGVMMDTVTTTENTVNIDVTFGGRKEFITSKDFKGGVISATFGGCEVNMMQADTTEKIIVLDMKISFGGVELIVPSHWEIQNEISPSFGSVEDERMMQAPSSGGEQKILLLKGTCSFGSIEIKSF